MQQILDEVYDARKRIDLKINVTKTKIKKVKYYKPFKNSGKSNQMNLGISLARMFNEN